MSRRIIDVHNHPNWHGVNIDKLVANMDEHGIEKTWLLSWEISQAEFDIAPIYHAVMDPRGLSAPLWMVVEGLHKYPDRFIGGWAPDPRDRHVRPKLKAAVEIHGIKVYGELKCRMRYDNPDAIATFKYCGELGLPVLFHLECPKYRMDQLYKGPTEWPEWYGGDITVVDNMCRMCPDTQFIGHGPGFWAEISDDADEATDMYPQGTVASGAVTELLRKYENLHCDLSAGSGCNGLARDIEHAKEFVTEFQDRILFGRDYFDRAQLDVLEKLDLSDEIMDKVMHRNAEKLLEDVS
ncbi:MAG: amidohydrolase family protein [Phycisphaerae bacterium]|nr:amidohydrolase family protein [Phycisphaerae bacterium]